MSAQTFEEWAERVLGPEVQGVNQQEWATCLECWHASRKAAIDAAEVSYDAYWEREYAEHNIDGADRGFGEAVWKASRGLS